MSGIDTETKRKLREMGAVPMLEALEAQDEALVLGMAFEERLRRSWTRPTPGSITPRSRG